MDWTPVLTAAVSAASGLTGACLGFFSTQLAARRNRDADKKKRGVDRLIDATEKLDAAYLTYTVAAETSDNPLRASARLQSADRFFDQAVGLIDHSLLRTEAQRYGSQLQKYYLHYGTTDLDDLDAGANVPTTEQLKRAHQRLVEKLRNYERN